ncbi:hypothetical protein [Treponema phagedenis]|uniref:hypothetical protein n=1 Tax=Treponema phagedenis TaxID=162 RepID=UPI0019805DDA|nr:hypothetical protein [Treponema phagedenis]
MLWNEEVEKHFFREALKSFASPEQLFYNLQSGYYAYIPKDFDSEGQTLQSRNSLIGQFTEKWCKQIFSPIAEELGLYAINGVVCEEIALTKSSSADLAFCTKNTITQKAEDIKLFLKIFPIFQNQKIKRFKVTETAKNSPFWAFFINFCQTSCKIIPFPKSTLYH